MARLGLRVQAGSMRTDRPFRRAYDHVAVVNREAADQFVGQCKPAIEGRPPAGTRRLRDLVRGCRRRWCLGMGLRPDRPSQGEHSQ